MTAAERMRRHRARQLGDDVPKVKPGPKPGKPQTLREASLEELIDEVIDRLTGRMADDREIRELAFRGVIQPQPPQAASQQGISAARVRRRPGSTAPKRERPRPSPGMRIELGRS